MSIHFKMFRKALVFTIVFAPTGCTGLLRHTLVHDGRNRVYFVHEPEGQVSNAMPLVIVLHGAGNDAKKVAKMTGMNDKSNDRAFLVAYPNGTGVGMLRTWNAHLCCNPALGNGVDDVGFIKSVISRIESNYNIDPKRIYVAGFSNGAMMSQVVACQLADRIAAIAPVAGPVDPSACTPSEPMSVITFHGTDDQIVRYGGGQFPSWAGGQSYASVDDTMTFWKSHDNCSTTHPPQQNGTIRINRFSDGNDGTEVVMYTIDGGNHSWPGGHRVSFFGQTPTHAISATDLIWEFFEQHPKP